MRCGEAARVGLHTESSMVQSLKESNWKSREMLKLDGIGVRCEETARVGLHAELSTVQRVYQFNHYCR
ncbi:hypothetical protein F2Q70_00042536 [Brassica cretica]|uniref:Uncharacterized protein n=1 Tax=Brassica cretica TaxID=69181 RepID=A0A8S9KFA8_BRACR|nr:hypothetical protein F2Q70_00042536 [Brassica cretica]